MVEADISKTSIFVEAARRLDSNRELIINSFEQRVREEIVDAQDETRAVLIDSLPHLLDNLIRLLDTNLKTFDQVERAARLSKEHAEHRITADFDLQELMWEYQILRQILFEFLESERPLPGPVRDLILDFVLLSTREATKEFVKLQEYRTLKPWRTIGLQHSLNSYLLSIAIVAVATAFQWMLYDSVGPAPYILFYPAVMICAIYANGPLAIVLSTIIAELLFAPEGPNLTLSAGSNLARIGLFVASGAILSLISQRLQNAQKRAMIESTRAREVAEKRDALAEINLLSLSARSLDEVFNGAANRIMRATQAPYVKVLQHEPGLNVFRPVAFASADPRNKLPSEVPVDERSLAGRALTSTLPVIVRDFAASATVNRPTLIPDPSIRSGMAVLIGGAERPFGVLVVQCVVPRDYTEDEKKFLQDAALTLANAVERFRAEEDLRKSEQQLVEINTGLLSANRALAGDREELSRSNKELSRFAAIAAHDLKSPLNTITQFIELIQFEEAKALSIETREYFQFIVNAANRMRTLIDRLLAYARAGAKSEVFKPVDTRLVLDAVEQNLRAALVSSAAKIKASKMPVVFGDQIDLIQVFQNLIGNALKFRKSDAPEITITAEDGPNSCWLFTVCDNGVGIPPSDLSKIFEPFMRVDTPDKPEGSGLGLAIVQKIIVNHGGRIWAESNPGEGTKFHFTIPKVPPTQ